MDYMEILKLHVYKMSEIFAITGKVLPVNLDDIN